MRRRWKFWLGLLISAAALILALLGIDLRQVAVRLAQIGYLVSNVLPFRLGDPARAVVLGRDENVSITAALSTVVVERVLDMLMVVGLLAGVAPFVSEAGNTMVFGMFAGGAALVVSVVLLALAFRPDWGRRTLRWVLRRLPRVDEERWAQSLDGLFEGLAPLRSGRRGLALLAWSVVAWAFVVGHYWAMLHAFLDCPSLVEAGFLTSAAGLGMAVPSAPGAVGVFHAFAESALVLPFGVPKNQAITIAFTTHAYQYILMCLLGLVGLARESISLGWVRARVASMEGLE
jgi:uncharacterized protein (TIRG00374 family)